MGLNMEDQAKSKEQILAELQTLRKRVADLESIEKELFESGTRCRILSEAAIDGVAIHENSIILETNDALAKMLGYEPSELVGMSARELFSADSIDIVLENIRSGHDKPYEASGFRKDGSPIQVEVVGRNISYKGKNARVAAIRDIADRKRAEKEKKELQDQLYQTDKMNTVGQLAAGISHEISNPICFMLPNLQLLQKHTCLIQELVNLYESGAHDSDIAEFRKANKMSTITEEITRMFSDCLDGAERVRDITRELRQFSRMDDAPAEQVDLSKLVESSLKIASSEIKCRARVIRKYKDIPNISVHRGKVNQVLLNIIINAVQAIEEGRIEENWIRVATGQENEQVFVEIANSGAPIPAEVLPKIFDPFFTDKPQDKGTGLGLSISYSIVQQHGGRIDVESSAENGTVFRVWLPVDTGLKTRPVEVAKLGKKTVSHYRILVIDDEEAIRNYLVGSLQTHHNVEEAKSGREAFQILSRDRAFDVVLCDLMMPDLSGMDLYERLEKEHIDITGKFIFLTGGAYTPKSKEFLKRITNPIAEKPIFNNELFELVNTVAHSE